MSKKIAAQVARGHQIRAQMKDLKEELASIEADLIEAGGGEDAEGRKAIVVESAPAIAAPEKIEDAQGIAGDHFGKLFEKVVTYKPVKSFREVAGALLTKAKAGRLISLCEKAKAPYIKWSGS